MEFGEFIYLKFYVEKQYEILSHEINCQDFICACMLSFINLMLVA